MHLRFPATFGNQIAFPSTNKLIQGTLAKPTLVFLALMIGCLVAAKPVQADFVVLGNLTAAIDDGGLLSVFQADGGFSIGFTVGPDPLRLTSFDLRMRTNGGIGTANLFLRESPSDTNGQLISSLPVNDTLATSRFSIQQPPLLAANKTYWLTIGTDAALGLSLTSRQSLVAPTTGIQGASTLAGYRFGPVGTQDLIMDSAVFTPTFQINGIQAVPEPSSLALLSLLGIGAGLRFPLFRRSQSSAKD